MTKINIQHAFYYSNDTVIWIERGACHDVTVAINAFSEPLHCIIFTMQAAKLILGFFRKRKKNGRGKAFPPATKAQVVIFCTKMDTAIC